MRKVHWPRVVALIALGLLVGWYAWVGAEGELYPPPSLRGAVIVVDPGHGGVDGGAPAPGQHIAEKDLTLELAFRLRTELDRAGAVVVLTRGADFDPGGLDWRDPASKRRSLQARVDLGRRVGAVAFVSLHMDSSHRKVDLHRGPNAYYGPGSAQNGMGKLLAAAIQERFRRTFGVEDKARLLNAYVLRMNSVPATLVECAFLNNPADLARIRDPYYQETLVRQITAGLGDYLQRIPRPSPSKARSSAARLWLSGWLPWLNKL